MLHRMLAWVLVLGLASGASGEVAYRVLDAEASGQNLLKPENWRSLEKGARAPAELSCDNGADTQAVRGFVQTVVLNQTEPRPIQASAWSRAQNVGGSKDPDYSLYLDITYADGEPLWGQSGPFRTGTHDWQKAQVNVFPAKPIREVRCYVLFRRHAGRAQFERLRLTESGAGANVAWLDGLPVEAQGTPAGGFLVRDVAAGSNWERFEEGHALGLKMEAVGRAEPGAQRFTCTITDTTHRDRAITLLYAVRVEDRDWNWLASPRRTVPALKSREYVDATSFSAGANGLLSRYPLAAIASGPDGQGISIDPAAPAYYRVGYSGAGLLYIAFDVGLAPERPSAQLQFCTFRFDGRGDFRGAVQRLYELFPESFRSRTPQQGVWMPFGRISQVPDWQDFGFRFKEGDNETAWDDQHGILTFRYTEPLTWWMPMPREMPRTIEAALAHARQLAAKGDKNAQALLASGYHDEAGQFVGRFRKDPWCDGIVWSMNSSPGLREGVTDFWNKWNPDLRERLYGPGRKADLDGEYVDSSEGYVTDELDFRRDHLAAAQAPLTFSTEGHRPAVFRGLIAAEYVRALAQDLHGRGKLTMANATPHRLCLLAPWLDVMGTETDWNPGGQWRPMSEDELLYRRVICGPKPYCFLMNTDFTRFSREKTESFMKRCLAYGMFPGFFSADAATSTYFSQPALYNRDRELFKTYIPLCRLVAEAGWRPLTAARSSDASVHVERFGEHYLTVFNDGKGRKPVRITPATAPQSARERLTGKALRIVDGSIELDLAPEDVALLELK